MTCRVELSHQATDPSPSADVAQRRKHMAWLRAHLFWILVGIAFVWIHTAVRERRAPYSENSENDV
jgi:uncharacterized membrane protein YidH (DUF202 family)